MNASNDKQKTDSLSQCGIMNPASMDMFFNRIRGRASKIADQIMT